MEERLFLDGVDVHRAGFPINERVINAPIVFPDTAIAPLLVTEAAESGAE